MLLVRIFCEEGELRAHYPEYAAYARADEAPDPVPVFCWFALPFVVAQPVATTLRSQTRVVQINVVVRDSKGRSVAIFLSRILQ